jgi:hypothetical protein
MKGTIFNLLITVSLLTVIGCGGGGGDSGPQFTLNKTELIWDVNYYDVQAPSIVVNGSATGIDKTVYLTANSSSSSFIDSMEVVINSNSSGSITIHPKPPSVIGIGAYTGQVTISLCYDSACRQHVSGSPQTLQASYTVKPEIRLTKNSLDMYSTQGSSSENVYDIDLLAEGVDWSIENIPEWLTVTPLSGNGDTLLNVSANNGGVDFGLLEAELSFISQSNTGVSTLLNINNYIEPRKLFTQQPVLAFSELSGNPANVQVLNVATNSEASHQWTIVSKSDWIRVDIMSGFTGQSINVDIMPDNLLNNGQYVGEIVFYSEELESEYTIQIGYYKNSTINDNFFEYELPDELIMGYNPLRAEMLLVNGNKLQAINIYTYTVIEEYVLPENFTPESLFVSNDAKNVYLSEVVGGSGDKLFRLSLDNGEFIALTMNEDYNSKPQYGSALFVKGKSFFVIRNEDSLYSQFDDFVIYGPDSDQELARIPSVSEYSGAIKSVAGSNYFYSSTWETNKPLVRYAIDYNSTANKLFSNSNASYSSGNDQFSLSKTTDYIALPSSYPSTNASLLKSDESGITNYSEVSTDLYYSLDTALFDENNNLLMINDSDYPYVQRRSQQGELLEVWDFSLSYHNYIDAEVSLDNKYLIVRSSVSVLNGNATVLSFIEI